MSLSLRSCLGLGGLLAAAAGCSGEPEPVKKPPAPDMSELVAAYEAPTAALTPEAAAAVLENVTSLVGKLDALGLEDQLIGTTTTTIDEQLAQSENAKETSSSLGLEAGERLERLQQHALKGDVYVVAKRICGGFGDEPMPDPANGDITLTLGISGDNLDPVIWGKFAACKYLLNGKQVLLGGQDGKPGSYSIYVGKGLRLSDFELSPILLQLSLWTELNGAGELLELDFALDLETLELDIRVPLEEGYVIAKASRSLVGINATNGVFGCDAEARVCDTGDLRIEF